MRKAITQLAVGAVLLGYGLPADAARPDLKWGTYFGGEDKDQTLGVTTDAEGNIYMVGETYSRTRISSEGAHIQYFNFTPGIHNNDAFLSKFNARGERVWSTYYGGHSTDAAFGVACDPLGNVYITGYTASGGLGTPGVYKDTITGNSDAFLAKFSPDGKLVWHTYYGGAGEDAGYDVVCDSNFNVYITGFTKSSTGIAGTGAHQSLFGGVEDAFVARFDSSGALSWGTYYGGAAADAGWSVTCDPAGYVYISGQTASSGGIAKGNAHRPFFNAFFRGYNSFLAKLDTAGNVLWGTYYGQGISTSQSVACDKDYNVYLAGSVMLDDVSVATPGVHQELPAEISSGDAFLVRFDSAGNRIWGTYAGGTEGEQSVSVACNENGEIYLAGVTSSPDGIATADAFMSTAGEAFLMKFDNNGNRIWGTYYGGGNKVVCDLYGYIYLSGAGIVSTDIATPGSHQEMHASPGWGDAMLAQFDDCPAPPATSLISGPDTLCMNSTAWYLLDQTDGHDHRWMLPANWTGTVAGDSILLTAPGKPGRYPVRVQAEASCLRRVLTGAPELREIYVPASVIPEINPRQDMLETHIAYSGYQWYKNNAEIEGATGYAYQVTENDVYHVEVTDEFGCVLESAPYRINNLNVAETGLQHPGWDVYPNPASGFFYIRSAEAIQVYICNTAGQEVYSGRHTPGSTVIRTEGWAEGVYMLRITDGQQTAQRKLMIRVP